MPAIVVVMFAAVSVVLLRAFICDKKMKIENPLDSIIIMEFKIIRIAYNKEDTV